jgi:hypothetical protein
MKCPNVVNGQSWDNIPDLIHHLWTLYSDMTLDPALTEPAQHVRTAALELEKIRRTAFEVYKEERAAFEAALQTELNNTPSEAEDGAVLLRLLSPSNFKQ